jgi:prefoldin beta subunit
MSENVNMYRQQLLFLTQQKQQIQYQINILDNTIKELEKTKEKKVYKGIGNVFIMSDKDEVLKETKDLKDTLDLRMKTVQKQEDTILKKINTETKPAEKSKSDKEDNTDDLEGIE